MNKPTKVLPITIPYIDSIELAKILLDVYSINSTMLHEQMRNLLVLCLTRDMNSKDFYSDVISADLGYNNVQQARTAMSRLKNDLELLIVDEKTGEKRLTPKLEYIKRFINGKEDKDVQIKLRQKV